MKILYLWSDKNDLLIESAQFVLPIDQPADLIKDIFLNFSRSSWATVIKPNFIIIQLLQFDEFCDVNMISHGFTNGAIS